MLIPFTQPLDLRNTLESGQAFRWKPDPKPEGGCHWYAGVVFGNLVKMRRAPDGVEFFSAPNDEASLGPLLRDYLRLEDDLDAIYRSIETDDRMRASISRYHGMRLLRQEPWECLVSFLCSPASNIPRISNNVEDMCTSFGRPIAMDGLVRHVFPTPDELAEAGEQRLRALGLGFRAKYVAAVARTVADGKLDLFSLRETPYEETLGALTARPGVGDKVANCVMLFSLDKLEAFPVDVWVRRALKEWYFADTSADKSVSLNDMRPWAQRHFGAYAGYANQYLFHKRRLEGRTER